MSDGGGARRAARVRRSPLGNRIESWAYTRARPSQPPSREATRLSLPRLRTRPRCVVPPSRGWLLSLHRAHAPEQHRRASHAWRPCVLIKAGWQSWLTCRRAPSHLRHVHVPRPLRAAPEGSCLWTPALACCAQHREPLSGQLPRHRLLRRAAASAIDLPRELPNRQRKTCAR